MLSRWFCTYFKCFQCFKKHSYYRWYLLAWRLIWLEFFHRCVVWMFWLPAAYLSQPRLRKYHMGPSALANISANA